MIRASLTIIAIAIPYVLTGCGGERQKQEIMGITTNALNQAGDLRGNPFEIGLTGHTIKKRDTIKEDA